MKNFDRILNIILAIAVVLFIADYLFIKETPSTFDDRKKADFAPVELGRTQQEAPTASDATVASPTLAVGGPEVSAGKDTGGADAPAPFTALSWEQLEHKINGNPDTPALLVVYTSWCPFCKKLIPVIVDLAASHKDTLNVVAISIDEDPMAIKTYISSLNPMPSFPTYLHSSDNERSLVQAFLYKNQLNFTGGIPYMALFHKGKPVQQFGGFVEKNVLTDALKKLEQQKNNVNTN